MINIFLLLVITSYPYNSYGYERNFSLSSVASFPSLIDELKNRWFFCEKSLNSTQCDYNDVKQCETVTLPDRNEALNLAVGRANTEAVYFLVNTTKADINSTMGEYNETPLIVCAYYGTEEHRKIADFLISHGANINAIASPPTDTALITAIWKYNIEFAKLLLKKRADPSITASGKKMAMYVNTQFKKNRPKLFHIYLTAAPLLNKIPSGCMMLGIYVHKNHLI
ncbi:ankyrin repeat domain-containing protein [Salmonella enterica subsp. salamae]|uniref:Ankyrin repeat domain-containing protein n=6 Tax=Salmonella enterica TaxID=28901 RepID=A0A3U9T3D5_SALER|nr:ankyrin repeat domain-containing protein [Salmonella enterica subsp. salamae]EAA9515924.1 ankyrin repeat domain-containing protein [Salmonella enterica]EBP3808482.1 ankyrin repeat domain-containing protein [Salmonella enterica subsp. enterica]ECT8651568.1 ankyrin repeat domain-containing protein [Salmonella enterica subsp. salamae serovar 50:b:z6]EDX4960187.1 ankyrin repeat domain-containing protein [Salmonella enterica subsp. salamae serovar 58:l,z13,z28:z6]EEJ4592335.1 ankyrin repeat doma